MKSSRTKGSRIIIFFVRGIPVPIRYKPIRIKRIRATDDKLDNPRCMSIIDASADEIFTVAAAPDSI